MSNRSNLRCECKVFDKKTNKYRLCKKTYSKIFNNKKICSYHFNSLYIKYCIKIQSFYRMFRIFRKVKLIKNLPDDIQHKILYYVNIDWENIKMNKKIANIILIKMNTFIFKNFNNSYSINYTLGLIEFYGCRNYFNLYRDANIVLDELFHIYYLLYKYRACFKYYNNYLQNLNIMKPYIIKKMFYEFKYTIRFKIEKYSDNFINSKYNTNYVSLIDSIFTY